MKNLIKTIAITIVLISIISCKNESKTDHNTTSYIATETGKVTFQNDIAYQQFQHYLHLKTALVNTNLDEAKSGAQMMASISNDVSLKDVLSKIVASSNIKDQRTLFVDVTDKMTKIVNESIDSGEVYQQFCPMAFNNKGAYWLSANEEIRNPYFGDRMLKCGKITKTIK